jgi:hypothetical protein
MANPKLTEIVTPLCRLSYPKLFEKAPIMQPTKDNPNPKTAYSCTILVPAGTDMKPFKAAVVAALQEKWPQGFKQADGTVLPHPPIAKRSPNGGNPLRPMEEFVNEEGGFPAGHEAGGYVIRTKSDYQPVIVNKAAQPVIDKDAAYAGVWCHFHLNAYAWEFQGKWGVSFGLNGVQIVKDGDRLDSRRAASDMFAPLEGAAPPAAAGAGAGKSDQDALFGDL